MPRFYFDLTDMGGFHRDDQGDDLKNFEEAREQCQIVLSEIAWEELPNGESHVISCVVRDDAGGVVYRGRLTYEGERDPM